jgi:hypothetical protein
MRHYLDHMIKLNIPLNKEWAGDVHECCEIDDIVYPHLVLEACKKYKNAHLVEMCVNNIKNRLAIIEDTVAFQDELVHSQFDLQCLVLDLEQHELKKTSYSDIAYSRQRTQDLVDKLNSGKKMNEGDFAYMIRHGESFAWNFRGDDEQYKNACNVRFTCSELGFN